MTSSAPLPLVVAIAGPDGAGKSTVCARLQAQADEPSAVRCLSVWDAFRAQGVLQNKQELMTYLEHLQPLARALFFFHAWAQVVEVALRAPCKLILLDSYWYKYACAELAHGADAAAVLGAAQSLPKPSLAIYLAVPPAVALSRKGGVVSPYESGWRDSDFVAFQAGMARFWPRVEDAAGGFVHVAAEANAEEAAAAVRRALLERGDRSLVDGAEAAMGAT